MKRKCAGRSVASATARCPLAQKDRKKILHKKIERVVINALELVATS
jgi:hypothetical protein